MAWNDIVSAPKRFFTIILSFFICSILVMGVVLVRDTMESKNLISTFGKESDVYITDFKFIQLDFLGGDGQQIIENQYKTLEADMEKEGYPCTVSMEIWYKFDVDFEGESYKLTCQQNTKAKTTDYAYMEGSAPQNPDEIAITPIISEMTGAKIGDVITIDFGSEKRNCTVVGYFQSMNQLGRVVRLHEDAPTTLAYASSLSSFQIDFDDNPEDEEINERIRMIKDKYDLSDVFNTAQYCSDCIGVTDTMDSVAKLLLAITCIVVVLVSVLMERSFISDEKGQTALLYAVGFKPSFVMKWHICRFAILAIISELFSIALTIPVTKLWCNPIFSSMGATNVEYYFKPLSLLVLIPLTIMILTIVTVTLTSLYVRKIKSRDIANIE